MFLVSIQGISSVLQQVTQCSLLGTEWIFNKFFYRFVIGSKYGTGYFSNHSSDVNWGTKVGSCFETVKNMTEL